MKLMAAFAVVLAWCETTVVTHSADTKCSTPKYGQCNGKNDTALCCPDTFYCQPWNPGYWQCMPKPPGCLLPMTGIAYVGCDIKTIYGVTITECSDRCERNYECEVYTFVNYVKDRPSTCYLKWKGDWKDRTTNIGAVSAFCGPIKVDPTSKPRRLADHNDGQ